ncbi:hypothetical protein ETB97_002733 [Aspergillus alliaceus]|uniref:DSBA-like thioredoxin domain-containing protein n=1 Tax=Petromyces alliaceus TaxID=209559 RepID=A0A8H6A553_PETAA|nr:hypothetical protein ETB97_002733 [Aspergillus burnettii]
MQLMSAITDKPEWEREIFDSHITAKWTTEIMNSGKDVTPKMMEWILAELKYKAKVLKETGNVTVYDTGVIKSNTAIPADLQAALCKAVLPLEQVPREEKDYHPGSEDKVVNLVHPSLYPSGLAETLPVPKEEETNYAPDRERYYCEGFKPYSARFQLLPCDVDFRGDDECRIVSYINNLHPERHRDLYKVLEKVIAKTIPLWDKTLDEVEVSPDYRIPYKEVEYLPFSVPEPRYEDNGEDNDDEFHERYEEWLSSRPIGKPEPIGDFKSKGEVKYPDPVRVRQQFRAQGLQVIVKLANIELTPDKPLYDGGSWHIEGQMNEHICATGIYYYSNENITQSSISFRQRAEFDNFRVRYGQDQFKFLEVVYGFPETRGNQEGPLTQELGSVTCDEGRLWTFPNILQHRVSPFGLADKTKPGYRKILALFLVAPQIRTISTANIPPQTADWWDERQGHRRDLTKKHVDNLLPVELDGSPITLEVAKKYRLELMEERSVLGKESNKSAKHRMLRRMDPKMVAAAQTRLKRVGADVGICFRFDGYIGSSRLAHQLLYMAGRESSERQCRVSELLFHYQFEKGADISQLETVVEVGVQAGLREDDVQGWLASDVGVVELETEARQARADGVKGVPHFVIGEKYHLEGAADMSELFEAFVKVREEQ